MSTLCHSCVRGNPWPIVFTISATLLILGVAFRVYEVRRGDRETIVTVELPTPTVIPAKARIYPIPLEPFIDPYVYYKDLARAKAVSASWSVDCSHLVGGVVNHHAIAGDLIGAFFEHVHTCRPDVNTFIVLSPDHYRAGTTHVTLGTKAYSMGNGRVQVDEELLARARKVIPFATNDDGRVFMREHGVGALLAYAVPVISGIRALPVTVDASITEQESATLTSWLAQEIMRGTFVIVSSDMSHYLSRDVALANDVRTKQAFEQADDTWFWNATDSFTDSGRGIATVLRALPSTHWKLWKEGMSTEYGGESGFTTSYLVGGWMR